MSSKKDYIDYVRDVLGVKSLYGMPAEPETIMEIPLVVYVEDYLHYTENEKDLLQKMLTALKLPLLQMHVLDFSDPKKIKFEMRVCLTDQRPAAMSDNPQELHTFSPRALLQNPALKKVAWDDLQKVLHFFQSKKATV